MIEKQFKYKGFHCRVTFNPIGYRCGYVGFPAKYRKKISTDNIDCHGGITYKTDAYYNKTSVGDVYWIGFDCIHVMDGYDVESIKKYFSGDKEIMGTFEKLETTGLYKTKGRKVWSLEDCVKECESIVNQLLKAGVRGC